MTSREIQKRVRIVTQRDSRFDGRFFYGVRTTRIYCRPGCPAKPKPENITIFKTTADAQGAGYRACLRCHPNLTPNHPLWVGSRGTVSKALRLIQNTPPEGHSLPVISARLGITGRQLRRLFEKHLGESPKSVLQTTRLNAAQKALRKTRTPITDIAFDSGFQSIRQFNATFKAKFQVSPSEWRTQ